MSDEPTTRRRRFSLEPAPATSRASRNRNTGGQVANEAYDMNSRLPFSP